MEVGPVPLRVQFRACNPGYRCEHYLSTAATSRADPEPARHSAFLRSRFSAATTDYNWQHLVTVQAPKGGSLPATSGRVPNEPERITGDPTNPVNSLINISIELGFTSFFIQSLIMEMIDCVINVC